MKKNFRSAFSLIELSIVILIIGILIAGVTQASSLVRKMRISSARTLTKSSPVATINNLTLWLESTSEDSFLDAETSDGLLISQWKDINPQSSSKFVLTAAGAARPIYTESGLNGLPVVTFGTGLSISQNIVGGELFSADQTTIFLVQLNSSDNTTQSSSVIWGGTNRVNIHATHTGRIYFDFGGTTASQRINYLLTGTDFYNVAKVLSFLRKPDGTQEFRMNDGTSFSATGKVGVPDIGNAANLTVGFNNFPGYIAEVIIYNRALKEEERRAVEVYLAKKWGIKLI